MTGPIPLILDSESVKRISMSAGRGRSPSVAVVYATRNGDLEVLDGGKPMGWSDAMLTKYRMRYEIDIADHHLTLELKDDTALPTQADIYHFHAVISASFRVTDPAEVIRRNVTDAVPLVHGHLLGVCRPITRQYTIEEAEEAEAMIHSRFRRDTLVQGGITLYAVEARLSLDEAGRKYLQDVEQATRDDRIKAAQHTTNVNDVRREGEIDLLKQTGRQMLEEQELMRLESRPTDDPLTMLRLHLARHPEDTTGALDRVAELEKTRLEHQAHETDRWQAFLQNMASQGMIQPTDVGPLLDAAVKHMENSAGVAGPIRVSAATGPATSAPQSSEGRRALDWDAPLADPPTTEPEPQNLCPVYVIVDESTPAGPLLDDLNTAIEDLASALSEQAGAASAVRLAVLGYAESAEVRLPMDRIGDGTKFPQLTTRGPADHARLFRQLADLIPDDMQSLRTTHGSVRPPLLVLFTASAPETEAWQSSYRDLVRQQRRSDIVVFGVGDGAAAAGDFCSGPELGFTSGELSTEDAIVHFGVFLTRYVVECGTAAAEGTEVPVPAPTGFRIADQT